MGLRSVLDQLDQFVLKDHRARGNREVASNVKGRLVDAGNPPLLEVIDKVLNPIRQAHGTGFDRFSDHLGIGRRKVRRTHRIDELPGIKPKLQFCLVVDLRLIHEFV